jgi:hypothetical protein
MSLHQPSELRHTATLSSDLRHVSLSDVRRLQRELDRFEKQAKMETEDSKTHSLGLLRTDLIEACRHRLTFITYMVKDADAHLSERKRPSSQD